MSQGVGATPQITKYVHAFFGCEQNSSCLNMTFQSSNPEDRVLQQRGRQEILPKNGCGVGACVTSGGE